MKNEAIVTKTKGLSAKEFSTAYQKMFGTLPRVHKQQSKDEIAVQGMLPIDKCGKKGLSSIDEYIDEDRFSD